VQLVVEHMDGTVREASALLRRVYDRLERPRAWIQHNSLETRPEAGGELVRARRKDGTPVDPRDAHATRWTVGGAITRELDGISPGLDPLAVHAAAYQAFQARLGGQELAAMPKLGAHAVLRDALRRAAADLDGREQ
jgi:hypothetical protein